MTNQKLNIEISYEDSEAMSRWEHFNWTFTTDKWEDIDIHIYQE